MRSARNPRHVHVRVLSNTGTGQCEQSFTQSFTAMPPSEAPKQKSLRPQTPTPRPAQSRSSRNAVRPPATPDPDPLVRPRPLVQARAATLQPRRANLEPHWSRNASSGPRPGQRAEGTQGAAPHSNTQCNQLGSLAGGHHGPGVPAPIANQAADANTNTPNSSVPQVRRRETEPNVRARSMNTTARVFCSKPPSASHRRAASGQRRTPRPGKAPPATN